MIRKKMIALLKRGACISLAAAVLSATAVPAAGAVYAKGNGSETTVSEEGTIPEKENGETQKKDDTKQNEETESGGEEEKTGSEKSEADSVKQSEQISGSNVVTEKISQTPQVQQTEIFPEQFYLNKTSQSLVQGATFQLATNGFSGNATNKEVTWSTSDPAVVTVNENGLVTAVGEGTAVVTATSVGKNADMNAPASASCTFNVDGVEGVYEYELSGNAVTITGYNGDGGDIVVPSTINGKPVTRIGKMAFWMDNNITSVVIPEGVTYIDQEAFSGDSNLVSVTLPSTLKTIYHKAFRMTALEKIVIPEGVTYIGTEAFNNCDNLSEVTLPSTLTSVLANAFGRCDAMAQEGKFITLPDNITYLGTNAFGSGAQQIQLYVANGSTTLDTLKRSASSFKYTAVNRYPESIALNNSEMEVIVGQEGTLSVVEFTGDPMNTDVTFESDNDAVATVDENGTITGVAEGTAVITVTAAGANPGQDAPASAQCTVRVLNKEGAYIYSTNETGVTIEQYTGAAMMITVPDEIGGRPVTAVAAGAFSNGNYIGDLTLPDTITSVSKNSFDDVSHLVAAKNTDTAKALEEAGFKYLAKVTVTFTTEFYNRDGSLSDTKGGTSIYTRREGYNLNMSTATYNRGWVLESETVTGMTDTNDALYKVEGTVGEEDITIKYVWREDNLGPDGEADKIPDQYQMDVTFSVVNGTWDDGLAETLDKFVTIRDENGNPAAEGSIEADLPGVGNAPAEGYEAGSWSPDVTSNLTVADEGTNFIYAYAEKQEVVDPDPEKPDEDKPGTDKPGIDKPDEDTDKIKENKKERTDSRKSNGEVQTSDTSPVGAAAGLLLLSGGVIIGVEELRRRKND